MRFIGNHLPSRAIDHDVYTSSATAALRTVVPRPARWLAQHGWLVTVESEWLSGVR